MILSVSRRTDIPAFYAEWFMNRLREGYVSVRNPMNYHQVSRVPLNNRDIEFIVFWTKNAESLLPYLPELGRKYPYYFQYTLNRYGRDVEPGLPPIDVRIDTFRRLSDAAGAERVIWRYDPVLITDGCSVPWHIDRFCDTARQLRGYTDTCVFSFIDLYDKVKKNVKDLAMREPDEDEMNALAGAFARAARENGMTPQTCAEGIDLDSLGVRHGACIDGERIARITGKTVTAAKDKNQRPECGCLESIDIGQYNTCRHGCRYCYANFNPRSVITYSSQHDPASEFLTGNAEKDDKVTVRKMKRVLQDVDGQLSFL